MEPSDNLVVDRSKVSKRRKLGLTQSPSSSQCCILFSPEHIAACSKLEVQKDIGPMVYALHRSMGLLDGTLRIPPPLSNTNICSFHSRDYLKILESLNAGEEIEEEELDEYGLIDDAHAFDGMMEYIRYMAGATVESARLLVDETTRTAIHWLGGRHHAGKDKASGFCYVNDVVLGILTLQSRFKRVLYIDLDVHHGDGVQDAFYNTDRVYTVSFHYRAPGFFPGTGMEEEIGEGKGTGYCCNVPLGRYTNDYQFCGVVQSVCKTIRDLYEPEVVVVQCGVDGLASDPLGAFNLSSNSFVSCLRTIMGFKLPLLVLGGGGYDPVNTAKCWSSISSLLCGITLPDSIPEHEFFELYGPSWTFDVPSKNLPEPDTPDTIRICKNIAKFQV